MNKDSKQAVPLVVADMAAKTVDMAAVRRLTCHVRVGTRWLTLLRLCAAGIPLVDDGYGNSVEDQRREA